ncbi:MAG TPA: kelch repeat-containing protein [Anaerolineae bacterium]|nr:kelch repeat-containing protein [Anaerolineae bacterium]
MRWKLPLVTLFLLLLWAYPPPSTYAEASLPGSWSAVTSMNFARENHRMTLLADGRVLVTGGAEFGGAPVTYQSAEIYDPQADSWSMTSSNMNNVRQSHSATLLADGTVLVAGGSNGTAAISGAEIYDPVTDSWTATGSMNQARHSHKAVRLLNGSVLVVGGVGAAVLDSIEIYHPFTGTWSNGASFTTLRANFDIVLLADGRVLLVGGYANSDESDLYQIYDPETNTWGPEGTINDQRNSLSATLLATGQVLLAGGEDAFPTTNVKTESFNPTTTVSNYTTGDMPNIRVSHTDYVLPNGQVLLVGGFSGGATMTTSAYDPATQLWSSSGSMVGNRSNNQGVSLLDGRILVTGGYDLSTFNTIGTSEIYEPSVTQTHCGVTAGLNRFHFEGVQVDINLSSVGDIDCLTVYRVGANHAEATDTVKAREHWLITAVNSSSNPASGYSADLILPHLHNRATDISACRHEGGGSWNCGLSQSATANTITVTNVNQFSAWLVNDETLPTAVTLHGVAAEETFDVMMSVYVFVLAIVLLLITSGVLWYKREELWS